MAEIGIIGGGVSGMTAAIAAARLGASVCLFEKTDRVGRKLLATGNGRCNLTNRDMDPAHFHGTCAELVSEILEAFGPEETEEFWKELGIEEKELEQGKVYPRSLQASSVLDALRYEMQRLEVPCYTEQPVAEIKKSKDGFIVRSPQGRRTCSAVILAAGGKASPKFGADGDGARLAAGLGLEVRKLRPALCRLTCSHPDRKALMGVKVEGKVLLYCDGVQEPVQRQGEILFTETGLSGPPVLELSRWVGDRLEQKRAVEVRLDLCPEEGQGQVFSALAERFAVMPYKTVQEALNGWLHKKLIPIILREAKIPASKRSAEISKKEIGRVAELLKGWPFPVERLAGWTEAQITVGGVIRKEITSRLESRRHAGLFLAGEVLDLDGDCGGYNIQWAVSSGYVAGVAAAMQVLR